MTVHDIAACLQADTLLLSDETVYGKDYVFAFATDLMSDALAMIQESPENTVLLTGLANIQSIRTAEMLDIDLIVLVRGKIPTEEMLEAARERGMNIIATKRTMYSACGCLYANGLREIND